MISIVFEVKTSLAALCNFVVMGKNVKLASERVILIEKRSDAQRTKQTHNVNIQVFTFAGTPGVQPIVFFFYSLYYSNHLYFIDELLSFG